MKTAATDWGHNPVMNRRLATFPLGPVLVALGAAGAGAVVLRSAPWVEANVFVAGAAWIAGILSGVPVTAGEDGWLLAFANQRLLVTTACSATDFFLMLVVVLGWHCAKAAKRHALLPVAGAAALAAAVPLTLGINALRLIAVAHAHVWVIPRMPEAYGDFLHMLTGAAVFLPALITLNLIFEIYGRSSASTRA